MIGTQSYSRAETIYDRITALYPRVREVGAYRRRKQVSHKAVHAQGQVPLVDRDLVVLSLVTKAITTHASVRKLTSEGLAGDAMALGRVLLENVILLEWLLRDSGYRLDLYAASDELQTNHFAKIVKEHYAHRPELVEQAQTRALEHEGAVRAIFGDTQWRWARQLSEDRQSLSTERISIENMFDEVAQPIDSKPNDPRRASFLGEVVYFEMSGFVHTHAMSLRKVSRAIATETFFSLNLHADGQANCARALATANLLALAAVSALNEYAALGLDEAIREVRDAMKAAAPP